MSAAKRVARAAETVRARWERQVDTDPQTEAAQALEDTGQLLDPEVAAELVAFRKARELAGAVAESGAFPVPVGPVLRSELDQAHDDVVGACLARWEEEQENERLRWALASAKRGRARLRAQVAALLDERHSTNESLDDAVQELRARPFCPCPPADQPGSHQVGCPQVTLPLPSLREVLGGGA